MSETIHLTVQEQLPVGLTTEQARVINAVSPTAEVERTTGGAVLTVHDLSGTTTAEIYDGAKGDPGEPGQDGVSPTATVSKSGGVTTIIITDKDGTTTASVTDGVSLSDFNRLSDLTVHDFDEILAFEVGDYVRHNGYIYRCTTAHEGAWDQADFAEVEVGGLTDRIKRLEARPSGADLTDVYDLLVSLDGTTEQWWMGDSELPTITINGMTIVRDGDVVQFSGAATADTYVLLNGSFTAETGHPGYDWTHFGEFRLYPASLIWSETKVAPSGLELIHSTAGWNFDIEMDEVPLVSGIQFGYGYPEEDSLLYFKIPNGTNVDGYSIRLAIIGTNTSDSGVSASVSKTGSTATITITDASGTTTAQVSDGTDGQDGTDGHSPVVTASKSGGVTTVSVDGEPIATINDGAQGDPGEDYVLTAQDKADIAGMVDVPVTDVQVNGTSVVTSGVANVPIASSSAFGAVEIQQSFGVGINSDGKLFISSGGASASKSGSSAYLPVVPKYQHNSVFYGLAKAAGADMASSSNEVGTYTDAAKDKIMTMLGIDALIAKHEGATASEAKIAGDVFIYNGKLYKATASIASGAAIVPGTNCTQTTIIDIVKGA